MTTPSSEIVAITDRVWANKLRQGFNVTDVPYEFMLTTEEIGEASRAWRHGGDVASELADVALFVFSLARMLDVDLSDAIDRKMTDNEGRAYVRGPAGMMVKANRGES